MKNGSARQAAKPVVTGRVYVGTSGWTYPHWRTGFYAGVRRGDWLRYCAGRFTGIEINATFYRLQERDTFRRWGSQVPPAFRFAVKGNRFLTHTRRLKESRPSVRLERDRASALGERLGAVLWQLPGNFAVNLDRLAAFCDALAEWPETRHAIEFRHPSWFCDEVAACLAAHDTAVCQSDAADWPLWDAVTAGLVYVRLHGNSRTYASRYATATLRRWAGKIGRWRAQGREVHVYFDNDAEGAAPYDALRLLAMLGAPAATD